MTTNSWVGGASGAFGTEGSPDLDWRFGHVPKSTEDAVINTGGSGDVVVTSNEDVGSITLAKGDDLYIETGIFVTQNGTGPERQQWRHRHLRTCRVDNRQRVECRHL